MMTVKRWSRGPATTQIDKLVVHMACVKMPVVMLINRLIFAFIDLSVYGLLGWYYVSRTLRLLWEDFITVDGFVMLPQVMWLTFVPFIHNSLLHGIISGSLDVADVAMVSKQPTY
ncbi:Maltose excess protein 1-like, chloroplastic [Zea mays]|uniref:Maltose excess protein 1-like, chloroplastic n=2 Tax=Zea mays TaxID=4577 RepID=A0A8J8XCV3_MAIZE|nr:Maltose excess protein 1 chloroplastic [Zea mays]PWZ10218.1 Maltose excess protein 1-like, chloroplastic [Zea mays]